jgi:mRNA interferase MazF
MLEQGQIVWIDFNPQKGREQSGRRPAVVISPRAYNEVSSCVLVCPITSNVAPWPWKVNLPETGQVRGAILVDQLKSIDARARHIEVTSQKLSGPVLAEVLARLAPLVS